MQENPIFHGKIYGFNPLIHCFLRQVYLCNDGPVTVELSGGHRSEKAVQAKAVAGVVRRGGMRRLGGCLAGAGAECGGSWKEKTEKSMVFICFYREIISFYGPTIQVSEI